MNPTERKLLDGLLQNNLLWTPHPDNVPQINAYTSPADVLYFGGAAGGGKSDLLLGLALTTHKKSIIFRRQYKHLRELEDRSRDVLSGTPATYNQTLMRWRDIPGGRTLEFGAMQHEKDKEAYKGRPHDLKAYDEIPDFTESQFRFTTAWARSTDPDQRVRVVCAGNPPTEPEGDWVIRYWAPWLDEDNANPAAPGELRWFATVDEKDLEVDGPEAFVHKGERIKPRSRSFIPSFLHNNPYLADSGYASVLQGMPEPLRSQLLWGEFTKRRPDAPLQTIPKDWVKQAQARWKERSEPEEPLTCLGVDPSRGGADSMEIARRKGNYFLKLLSYPGSQVPDGPSCAALTLEAMEDSFDTRVNIDVIGIGSSGYDFLKSEVTDLVPINSSTRSTATDKSGQLEFANLRAEMYWKFREALDPESGEDIALPPDSELVADLTAPRWSHTSRGILIEKKRNIRKRLGRSPGKADSVVMCWYQAAEGVYFA